MTSRMLAFHLTDRCNLNCQHCLRDPALTPRDLDPALIARTLLEARDHYGIGLVSLTGGEPFLHPELPRILDDIVAARMQWHAVTNASRMGTLARLFDEVPARREAMTRLFFSLDGASEATHDAIRGAGSFREVVQAVSLMTYWNKPFVLQLVINARNHHELEAFAMLAGELGAERASFAWMQPTGTHLDAELRLEPDAWREIVQRIQRIAQVLRVPVGMPEGFPTADKFYVCAPWRGHPLHIDVEGRHSLCCQLAGTPTEGALSDSLADLQTESLLDGHRRMIDLVGELQRRRLATLASRDRGAWVDFPCNWCLAQFGKPHWSETGAEGASATRDRWRGAWENGATGKRRLPLA